MDDVDAVPRAGSSRFHDKVVHWPTYTVRRDKQSQIPLLLGHVCLTRPPWTAILIGDPRAALRGGKRSA